MPVGEGGYEHTLCTPLPTGLRRMFLSISEIGDSEKKFEAQFNQRTFYVLYQIASVKLMARLTKFCNKKSDISNFSQLMN